LIDEYNMNSQGELPPFEQEEEKQQQQPLGEGAMVRGGGQHREGASMESVMGTRHGASVNGQPPSLIVDREIQNTSKYVQLYLACTPAV
jgi:hypothetical protein